MSGFGTSYRARRPSAASGCLDDYYTDTLGLGFTTEMTSGLGFSMPESHVPVVGEETLAWATVVLAYAATLDATAPPSSPRTSRPSPRPSTRAPSAAPAPRPSPAPAAPAAAPTAAPPATPAPAPRRPFIGRRGRLFSAVGAGAGAIAAVVAAFFALVGLAALIVSRRARAAPDGDDEDAEKLTTGDEAGAPDAGPRARYRDDAAATAGDRGGDPGIELV